MPSFKNIFLAAASAALVTAKSAQVNVYYGQRGNDDLGAVCSTGVDYVTLAFVDVSPENGGPSRYAGDNFADHCYAGYYPGSSLLYDCPPITNNWQICKEKGVKLLLSVGGVFSSGSNYTVSTDANAIEFANFLWYAFGPYDPDHSDVRPFDIGDSHFFVDGFDLDIEEKFANQGPWNTFVAQLRTNFAGGDFLITAAPQCPFQDSSFEMTDILAGSKFDLIWIQFYNNPVCDGINGGFNFDRWITYLDSTPNEKTPLFIGLPASQNASGSGYLEPKAFEQLIVNNPGKD
ncbi:MAG: Chitinase 2 [Sporothrix epigloea]